MYSTEDSGALKDLGRASVQIVHDLKNQLNGLKLYATFLRKRIEKSDRPADELETINKLVAGLDRAASDLSTVSQYGRDIELKTQGRFDLSKTLCSICAELTTPHSSIVFESDGRPLRGEFDPLKLSDALKWITVGVMKQQHQPNNGSTGNVTLHGSCDDVNDSAVLEWTGSVAWDHDPFRSFAGPDQIRMSLAGKIVEAHGGSTRHENRSVIVTLPLEGDQVDITSATKE